MPDPREVFRKNRRIFEVWVGDDRFLVRPLKRDEYSRIMREAKDFEDRDRLVVEAALLYPQGYDWESSPAGLLPNVAEQILILSGFLDPQVPINILQKSRESLKSFEAMAETVIRAAFPNISFEEMRSWDVYEFMDHLARAEWVLRNVYGVDPGIDIAEPEEPPEEELVKEIREKGLDPMLVLPLPPDPPFVPFPFITNLHWNKQEVVDAIGQGSTERRDGLLE